ncbi:MAG TPA: hypothetical protein VIL88_09325 [Devosia sp.]|jgi:hypothetical protein|uniref:hypothetical protein n=1 Tax=Devosia sp. TaxID=1871048 RepID=UPI002F93F952
MAKILTNREDIRQWTEARSGYPMLMDTPDGTGTRTLLQLTFGQHALNSENNEGPDRLTGFQLADWDDWFAALEENNLAIRVSDDPSGGNENEFEFVARDLASREEGEGTTGAAQKPAVITIQNPDSKDRAAPDAV